MARRMTTEEYIEKAKNIHGDKYDYSKVEYKNGTTKVTIICPIHGEFLQRANAHTNDKQGCPECAKLQRKETCKKLYGHEIVACSEESIQKSREACRKKFGGDSSFCSKAIQDKAKQTILERYGVDNVSKDPMIKEKIKQTNLARYGHTCSALNSEIKRKQKESLMRHYGVQYCMQSDIIKTKAKQTCLKKYGVDNPRKNKDIDLKIKNTCLLKYGCEYPSQNKDVQKKIINTKYKNHTFNTSGPEEMVYEILISIFGISDVKRQYVSPLYPFRCDFYIVSRDMYIELNYFVSHGKHWFNKNSKEDIEQLDKLIHKMNEQNSLFYKNSIETWTVRDVKKREIAKKSNLNYAVFWDSDLTDFNKWIDAGCPDRYDW